MNDICPHAPVLAAVAAALVSVPVIATPVGFDVLSTSVSSNVFCSVGPAESSGGSICALPSARGAVSYAETAVDGGREYDNHGGFFDSGFVAAVRADASVQSGALPQNGSVKAQITATVILHTDGALRQGYADFYALGGPFQCAWPQCSASLSVASHVYTDLGGYRERPPNYTIPVLLGTDLEIVLQAFVDDRYSGRQAVSASMAGIDIAFREDAPRLLSISRFAADVAPVPEPATFAVLAVGLLFLSVLPRRATRRR